MTAIGFSAQIHRLRGMRYRRYKLVDIISPIATLSPSFTASSPTLNNWPLVRARLNSLRRAGVLIRGHGLLSPRRAYLPQWMGGHVRHCALTGKYQDPIQAPANNRRAWLRQVHNACTYTKGLVVCQDVVTELFTPAGYNMVGILPELLEVARQADPKTPKFLNELLMMPDRNWGTLFDLIEKYPVEGIAIQIHADVRDDFSEISSRLKEIGSEVKDRGLRLHVSEVQIVCPPGEEMARLHAEVHLNLFELSHAAGAECYIVWGDNDNCARIPRTTISTYSSGFHDGKSPIALKPVFKALLWHPSRTLYPG